MLLVICLWNNLPFHTTTQANQITWVGLIYISPLARLKEFCFGMLAAAIYIQLRANDSAILKNKTFLSITEIALLGVLILGFLKVSVPMTQNPNSITIFWYQIVTGLLFAGIIIVFATEKSLISRSLNSRWLLTGGDMSLSIYLFHQMLITWQAKHPWLLNWAPVQARFLIMLCIILALSYAIWRWFERPMRTVTRGLLERC
jgi:peptidoglycan/LPS O-acetylase OafA/YrhL